MRRVQVHRSDDGVRYENVVCNRCGKSLEPGHDGIVDEDGRWRYLQADEALHVRLGGGYGELIDLEDESDAQDCHALLCKDCVQQLAASEPWLTEILFRHINLNVGHTCVDGNNVWVAQPDCTVDKDRHGWRCVYTVRKYVAGKPSQLVTHFDDKTQAVELAQRYGEDHRVGEELIANVEQEYARQRAGRTENA